jgi:hypothetical protein
MIELFQITNNPDFARRCDALDGFRLFVDLERNGKAERQAGRNTFISAHDIGDVGRVKAQLTRTPLMVRVNPLHEGTRGEVDAVLTQGADLLMLPMFTSAEELLKFSDIVAGRAPIVPLLETRQALQTLDHWIATPGLAEVFVGLNDLHLSLGCRFMFEPLALGMVERVAVAAKNQGLRFGFGGIARLDEGLLPGRDVLAEHVRLGSQAVILSRTFHGSEATGVFEDQIKAIRAGERSLALRSSEKEESDRIRIHATIAAIAERMGQAG